MAPVWSSGFRPFFLASVIYGPAVMLVSLSSSLHPGSPAMGEVHSILWHGHELLCGWAGALIGGFLLTALPSWAGVQAIAGVRLAALFLVWAFGRLAMWLPGYLPAAAIATLDLAFLASLAAALLPTLLRARHKPYLAVILVLAALFCGNLLFHAGTIQGDAGLARFGLQLYLGVLTFLFSMVAGLLTPVFTEGALRNAGHEIAIPFHVPLEIAAAASVLIYVATVLAGARATLIIAAGSLVLLIHGLRMGRWYRPGIAAFPLVWVMHLAYAWLLFSVLLRVLSAWDPALPVSASLNAFTVGALGLMQLGLLCRVALRHTGRPLVVSRAIEFGIYIMLASALLRVAGAFLPASPLTTAAAISWLVPSLIYLVCHGRMLLSPSLPRTTH